MFLGLCFGGAFWRDFFECGEEGGIRGFESNFVLWVCIGGPFGVCNFPIPITAVAN